MNQISGPTDSQESSQMTKDLTDEKKIKKNIDIFPFYKTLSKLCHWSINSQKDAYGDKKIKQMEANIAKCKIEIEKNNVVI